MASLAPTFDPADDLHARDTVAWAREQTRLMRERRFSEIDWANLIEEIEYLAGKFVDELTSRLMTAVEHLLKLRLSEFEEPRRGWLATVGRSVDRAQQLIESHPSLGNPDTLAAVFAKARASGGKLAGRELLSRYEVADVRSVVAAAERLTLEDVMDEARWPTL